MDKPIDISVRLHPLMPTWPGSTGVRLTRTLSLERGDGVNVTRLDMDVHSGTHVEAPLHFVEGGAAIEDLGLEVFVGPAWVADVSDVSRVDARRLTTAGIPEGADRLLLRTGNSTFWADGSAAFRQEYTALTSDGARWIADREIRLVGIDYLSVQLYDDDPEAHLILMQAGIGILEGLDLSKAREGGYRLTCLPLWLAGAEAAPARAILEDLS